MQIRTDDPLYRVDRTWLGPKILRFPWRATYTAYFLALCIGAVTGFIGAQLGAPINFVTVVIWGTGCLLITRFITRALNPDRPISAALTRLGQELSAPRPAPARVRESRQRLIVRRWRFGAEPETRRLVRWATIARDGTIRAVRRLAEAMTRAGGVAGTVGRGLARVSAAAARRSAAGAAAGAKGVTRTPGVIVRTARHRRPIGPARLLIEHFHGRKHRRLARRDVAEQQPPPPAEQSVPSVFGDHDREDNSDAETEQDETEQHQRAADRARADRDGRAGEPGVAEQVEAAS